MFFGTPIPFSTHAAVDTHFGFAAKNLRSMHRATTYIKLVSEIEKRKGENEDHLVEKRSAAEKVELFSVFPSVGRNIFRCLQYVKVKWEKKCTANTRKEEEEEEA